MVKRTKPLRVKKPMMIKIEDIHIPKKDYPTTGQFPPDSVRFHQLKSHMQKHGQLIPVFIDRDKLLLQGHYRLWAWNALGEVFIRAYVVEGLTEEEQSKEIEEYFDSIPMRIGKKE